MALDPNVVIDRLGGTGATARLFEISDASVSEWRKNGIPKPRMQFLRVARPDVLVPVEPEAPERAVPEPSTA